MIFNIQDRQWFVTPPRSEGSLDGHGDASLRSAWQDRLWSLKFIIGPYRWPGYFGNVHNRALTGILPSSAVIHKPTAWGAEDYQIGNRRFSTLKRDWHCPGYMKKNTPVMPVSSRGYLFEIPPGIIMTEYLVFMLKTLVSLSHYSANAKIFGH